MHSINFDTIQQLVIQYGYWIMLFAAIIEGETFLLAGGIAAQQGLLSVPVILVLAVIGSMFHDNLLFFIGRYFGHKALRRFPTLKAKTDNALHLFEKHGVIVILLLRYAYGLRTIIPVVLGMSEISFKKFLLFDFIGGVLWSMTFVFGGYIFGQAIEKMIEKIAYYKISVWYVLTVIGIFILICIAIFMVGRIYVKKRNKRNSKGKKLKTVSNKA
ncbi:MAG: DedA family protein [Thiotrichales bacterium]|nr:MAG: DedA family protein [Thiotrichales bacterium]